MMWVGDKGWFGLGIWIQGQEDIRANGRVSASGNWGGHR
jgi:hypothetical protein